MRTKLIDGTSPRPDDQQITAAVEAEADRQFGGGGMEFIIGVRNASGQLYRAFGAQGMGEFVRAGEALKGLGLTDELDGEKGMRHGCDAIFA